MPNIPSKIADGLQNSKDILGDRYTSASTDDGKLWFISRKGVPQPSISYYHETPLQGGNVVNFDIRTRTWSSPIVFGSISDEELLEGVIFGYKHHLLLLTYEESGRFQFRDLYEWRQDEWRKIDRFEIDDKTKFDGGARMKRANDAIFLIERGHGVYICRLELADDGKKSSITLQREITPIFPENAFGSRIVRAAVRDDHLYALSGQQGCGFRWEPTRPFRIDLRDGSIDRLIVGDDTQADSCPPWSFSGAYADHFLSPSRWFFFGGCLARGMSSTAPDHSIWELDMEQKRWLKFEAFDLPEGARFAGVASSGAFYVVNINDGVYEIDPNKSA